MKSCEEYEIELSSLLDRELSPAEAADAIEHALSCPGCNHFYRAARRLQALTAITGSTAAPAADDEEDLAPARAEQLWRQVRAAGAPPAAAASWQRPLRAAALVVLGLGGGYWLAGLGADRRPGATQTTVPAPAPASGTTIATANGATGATPAMDEHRFVALAAELLGADVRYQRAMLEVLRLVPALETGEGLSTEDGQRGTVLTRLDDAGAI